MPKLLMACLALALTMSGAAYAQQAPKPDSRGACSKDYERFCAGTEPGGGRVVACLNKQRSQLSETCRQVLDSRKK